MNAQRDISNRTVALLLAASVIGALLGASILHLLGFTTVPTEQQSIYNKLYYAGISFFSSEWEPDILENRTMVHQFREFSELIQLAEELKTKDKTLVVHLDNEYNIIWRTNSTNEGWISIYFYTEPD